MLFKFRFYILLTCCSGFVLFGLYKLLSVDEESLINNELHPGTMDSLARVPLNPMKNVNELLYITQPSHHLHKQKLREAEVHDKMRQDIKRRETTPSPLDFKIPNHPNFNHRLVHLDLKGAPPTTGYYKNFFPLITSLFATGILIEYEDMFPYSGSLSSFKAYNAYSKSEIQEILSSAKSNNLEVIPLIQTFGHLEFVLKQPQYMDLREIPEYPQVICPSRNNSMKIIKEMVDQVVEMHPGIKWIHIGADEVYYLGHCEKCLARLKNGNMNHDMLFISHVIEIAKYIKDKYKIQPIMWDDMFRSIPEEFLRDTQIWKYVDPMVWKYTPNVEEKLTSDIWLKYAALFPNIWTASAFKGATKSNTFFPNIKYHLENQLSWMKIIKKYENKINFQGIALTGWQRYDHFAVLCELLPVAIPSLALNLMYLKEGKLDFSVINRVSNILKCQSEFNITWDYQNDVVKCSFPGSKAFVGAQRLANIKNNLEKILNNGHSVGWITDYHVRMKFGSPAHIRIGIGNLHELITNTTLLYSYMERALLEVYDTFTTREWLETSVAPIVKEIKAFKRKCDALTQATTWPRRPLVDPDYKDNSLKELANLNRPIEL